MRTNRPTVLNLVDSLVAQPKVVRTPEILGANEASLPAFERIKRHVTDRIQSGAWREGEAIPAEETLAKDFGVSRMTVNRALRELSDERIVIRVRGSGTFVAQQKYQATLVEIKNIAEEVRSRGHVHKSELHVAERCKADEALASQFEARVSHPLFHTMVVHYENDVAIQAEDRYVNPFVAPDYLEQDFRSHTTNEYLMRVAPLQGVRFVIEACVPPPHIAEMLEMKTEEPCLVLRRRTYSQGHVASVATMWHPASRYKFAGSF